MATRILIINPNTTQSMTDGLKPLVESLGFSNTEYTYFTAPSGPSSINNNQDVLDSVAACFPSLEPLAKEHRYDAYLVACYSHHPLVSRLRDITPVPVLGIFEASVTTALQLLSSDFQRQEQFGIVSTGKIWEELLGSAVLAMLGGKERGGNGRFAGVETTGLNATELHDAPREEVRRRIQEAAGRLVRRGEVRVVILGCAGMAGMGEWVREEAGEGVRIVDGVMAGVGSLVGLVKGGF
ncbi:hypothetical protein MMC30_000541 [Trapelia coarctata]|nr:hypothetical protein [Trapelia coarctata]